MKRTRIATKLCSLALLLAGGTAYLSCSLNLDSAIEQGTKSWILSFLAPDNVLGNLGMDSGDATP